MRSQRLNRLACVGAALTAALLFAALPPARAQGTAGSGSSGMNATPGSNATPGTTTTTPTNNAPGANSTTGATTGTGISGAGSSSTGAINGPGASLTPQSGAITVEGSGPMVLDLPTAIKMTIAASNDYAVATKNLDRDAAQVDEAEAAGRPKVGASATETFLSKAISIPFAGETFTVEPQSTQDILVEGTLPIDITGLVSSGVAVYRLQLLADRFTRDRIQNSLILKAETTYYDLLRSQHQVDVASAALQDAQTQLDTAGRQYNGGTGLKIDMLRAQTQVSTAQQNLLEAQNMLALARTNLNDATGRPLNAATSADDVAGVTTGVAVPPSPAITPPPPGQAAPAPAASEPTYFEPPTAELESIDVDKSINQALVSRPELEADQVNIEAAKRQIKLARRSMDPSLSLTATGNDYPTTSFENPYRQVGALVATVTFPLYDGGVARDEVREARDNEDNLKSTYLSNQTDVSLQVRQAYLSLLTAGQQIGAANSALHEAVAARELAQVRYANGVGLYLEVTDAESALTAAETNQVNAVYGYLVARAQFENALGTPSINPKF